MIMRKDDKIIAIPEISRHAQRVLHKPIEFMQVDVRENLARDVADGDSPPRQSTLSLSLSSSAEARRRAKAGLSSLG